jgi:hypothetical protein
MQPSDAAELMSPAVAAAQLGETTRAFAGNEGFQSEPNEH